MNILTGYRGEPHITSSQDRAQNQGAFGTGSYILDVGQELAAEIISANEIRIRDGVLSHQGCVANIEQGAYDSLEISNGSQGMLRRDLIVARYTKDAETNVEDLSLVVIEGTPASSNPSDPAYNHGDIQSGDSPVDMPLYRVNINGVAISSVTKIASVIMTQADASSQIGTLTDKTNLETLNILLASSNYSLGQGFAFRIGKLVVFSINVSISYTLTSNTPLFRFRTSALADVVPAKASNESINWRFLMRCGQSGSLGATGASSVDGHIWLTTASPINETGSIYVAGTFICE